jgi:putative Ca2+/H+ antiporter (TMEM165/GDT1 family)
MDWKLFFATFVTIFLAELGDKTQFAAMAAGSKSDENSLWPILLAVVLALGLAGTLGVFFGKALASFLNPNFIQYLSGSLFILVGLWILFKG